MPTVYALLNLAIGPFVAILVVAIWIVLLVRFGLLTLWLEELELTVDEENHITRNLTRVLLGLVLFGIPIIMPIIYCSIGNEGVNVLFPYSPIWLVLVILGWLVLLCYFGLSLLLNWLNISVDRYERINRNVVMAILLIGILTGFVGLNWLIYTENTGTVEELYRWGLLVLSPMTTLLTMGLVVTLLFSLVQALPTQRNDEKYKRFTKVLLLTFVLLSVVGSILSIYPFL